MRTGASRKVLAAIIVIVVVTVASFALYETFLGSGPAGCLSIPEGGVKSQASSTSFGAVTEYKISGQNRWPNGITSAPDGTVWFAEESPPGVVHLYPSNGTLVEYPLPGLAKPQPPDCAAYLNISGMAVWNGRVWAADEFGNLTIGVNPSNGGTVSVNSSSNAPFPYWLAVGPDGNLWFTSNNFPGEPARLGMILSNLTLRTVDLVGLGDYQPVQIDFVNATLAYLSTINEATNSTSQACACTGHIYSFNPSGAGPSITPTLVGGNEKLILTTSVTYAAGSVWATQHGGSNLVGYNLTSGTWKTFPTSLIPWSEVTLPLESDATGNRVWFNEHIANKIAFLDPSQGTLTEYSESNPPTSGEAGIQNDLSITATQSGLWFTSISGNYVGFVDPTVKPGFGVNVGGANHATVAQGGNASFQLSVSGSWSTALSVNSSDSENLQSIPKGITITSIPNAIPAGSGPVDLRVEVEVGAGVPPGAYTVAVTVTNQGLQQTAYLFVQVN